MNHALTRAAASAFAVIALSALAACGSTSAKSDTSAPSTTSSGSSATPRANASGGASSSQPAMIMIQNFAFTGPGSLAPGAEVTVMNMDSEAHTVTADGTGGFDVKVDPGKSATFKAPTTAGDYKFHCMFHANMHGSLTVG